MCERRPARRCSAAARPDRAQPRARLRLRLPRLARAVLLGPRRGARHLFRRDLVRADGARADQVRDDAAPGASAARQAVDRLRHAPLRRQSDRLAGDERAVRIADAGRDAHLVLRVAARSRPGAVGERDHAVRRRPLRPGAHRHARYFLDGVLRLGAGLLHPEPQGEAIAARLARLRHCDGRLPRPGERVQAVGTVPALRRHRRAPAAGASQALARAFRGRRGRRISSPPTPGRR